MYRGSMTKHIPRDEAFMLARVHLRQSGCWNWTRSVGSSGYGLSTRLDGSRVGAHVLSYEIFTGPVPFGLEVDHTCNNRRCCNPRHLEAVTQQENSRRASERGRYHNSRKDRCPRCQGPYETFRYRSRPEGFRRCRPCHSAQQNEYQRARRAAVKEAQRG